MNKKYIIRKNEEIQIIIKNCDKKIVNKFFVIYYRKNKELFNKYCISISKKIGKAHIRNLYKRRLKNIIMKNSFKSNYDYVIILRKPILDISFLEIEKELINCMKGDNI